MPTKIEMDGQTSLEDAMREFRILSELNANNERQVRELTVLGNKLSAENTALRDRVSSQEEFYRTQIETLSAHRDRLQRKCVALITRLSGIKDAIVAAERDAHDEAIRDPGAPNGAKLSDADEATLSKLALGPPEGDSRLPAVGYQ